jgi:7-keto-8-aminopelargonate synthetase-like enzyme
MVLQHQVQHKNLVNIYIYISKIFCRAFIYLFISGTLSQHRRLEALLSEFLGTEDAITFGMGFATNALNIPSIVGKVNEPK